MHSQTYFPPFPSRPLNLSGMYLSSWSSRTGEVKKSWSTSYEPHLCPIALFQLLRHRRWCVSSNTAIRSLASESFLLNFSQRKRTRIFQIYLLCIERGTPAVVTSCVWLLHVTMSALISVLENSAICYCSLFSLHIATRRMIKHCMWRMSTEGLVTSLRRWGDGHVILARNGHRCTFDTITQCLSKSRHRPWHQYFADFIDFKAYWNFVTRFNIRIADLEKRLWTNTDLINYRQTRNQGGFSPCKFFAPPPGKMCWT